MLWILNEQKGFVETNKDCVGLWVLATCTKRSLLRDVFAEVEVTKMQTRVIKLHQNLFSMCLQHQLQLCLAALYWLGSNYVPLLYKTLSIRFSW